MFVLKKIIYLLYKILFYNFKFSNIAKFKLILLFSLFIFLFFFMFSLNKYFICYINEYYVNINNDYLKNLVSFISNLFPCNLKLTKDSYDLYILIILIFLFFMILFILSFFFYLIRLPFIWICGNFLTSTFGLFENYVLNLNNLVNFYGIDIRKKLINEEKIQFIYDIHSRFISSLEPNLYLDKCFNEEVVNYLLFKFEDINNPFALELNIKEYLMEHVVFIEGNDMYNTKLIYLAAFIGIIVVISLGLIFYTNNSTYVSHDELKNLTNLATGTFEDLEKEKMIIRIINNNVNELKDKVSKLETNSDSLDKSLGTNISDIALIKDKLYKINEKLNLW